jgi:hypothetical protein
MVRYAKKSLFVNFLLFLGVPARLMLFLFFVLFFVFRGRFGTVGGKGAERFRLCPPPLRIFRTIFCAD